MSVRRSSRILAPLAAVLGLALAGCGGAQTGSSDTSAASLVRANTLVFVAADSDFHSSQWQKVDALSKKFPDREKALQRIERSLQKDGVDFKSDVEPALGPEFDFAVVPGANFRNFAVAGLTKPDDAGKFKALVEKANKSPDSGKAVFRDLHNGWFAVSDTQAHIDQVLKQGDKSLADESVYNDALGKLPSDRLTSVYVNGPQLGKLVQKAVRASGNGLADTVPGLTKLDYVSAALSAEDDGLRVKGAAAGSGASSLTSGDYESKLISGVPADALAFLTFRAGNTLDQLKTQLETNPTFSQALPQLEQALGVSVAQILDLFSGETAAYVRPGGAIPEISLALSTSHEASALKTLDRIAARLGILTHAKVTTGHQGGHATKTIDFGQISVTYAGLGDRILLTTGLNGIDSYSGSGSKLSGSAAFREAKAAAGMPSSNAGFEYLDVKNSVALIEGLAALSGSNLPAEVTDNLKPLQSFLAWSGHSGNATTFDAFLEIR